MFAGQRVEFFPLAVQHWFSRRIAPDHRTPSRQKLADAGPDVVRIVKRGDHTGPRQRSQSGDRGGQFHPVIRSESDFAQYAFPSPNWRMHAQPPGPRLPKHDPSAVSLTFIRILQRAFGNSPCAHCLARRGHMHKSVMARLTLLLRGPRRMLCRHPANDSRPFCGEKDSTRDPPERNTAPSLFSFINASRQVLVRRPLRVGTLRHSQLFSDGPRSAIPGTTTYDDGEGSR